MDRVCSSHELGEKYTKLQLEKLKEKIYLGDVGSDGRY
jgi:hypothetical protein